MFVGFERSVCTNSSGVFICISALMSQRAWDSGQAAHYQNLILWRRATVNVRSERLTEAIFRRCRTTRGESAARHVLLTRARLQELHLPEDSDARRARVSDRHVGNGGDGCLSCPVPLPLAHHAHPCDRSG